MTAKEYLQLVKVKEAQLKNLQGDRQRAREMLFSLGGGNSGERVQSSRNFDKMGTLFGQIDETERDIEAKIADLFRFRMKVSGEINSLEDERYIVVLNARYIQFKSWADIADKAFEIPYSERHIKRLHGKALKAFQETYADMLEKM